MSSSTAAQHSTGTDNGHALLAEHRDDHGPFTGPGVALQVEDLLPGAQQELALAHWDGQPGAQHGRLQVGMAVAVVPGLLVAVITAGGA